MESGIQKNKELLAVRDASVKRLARFANSAEAEIEYCYLFHNDHFVGVRYRAGAFVARWLCKDLVIQIFRGSNLIDQFPLHAEQKKAA